MSDDKRIFTLKHPFTARSGQSYNSLTARDPKVRDVKKFMKLAPDDETNATMIVMADLCEVPPEVIGDVHIRDYIRMKNWFMDFFKDTNDE